MSIDYYKKHYTKEKKEHIKNKHDGGFWPFSSKKKTKQTQLISSDYDKQFTNIYNETTNNLDDIIKPIEEYGFKSRMRDKFIEQKQEFDKHNCVKFKNVDGTIRNVYGLSEREIKNIFMERITRKIQHYLNVKYVDKNIENIKNMYDTDEKIRIISSKKGEQNNIRKRRNILIDTYEKIKGNKHENDEIYEDVVYSIKEFFRNINHLNGSFRKNMNIENKQYLADFKDYQQSLPQSGISERTLQSDPEINQLNQPNLGMNQLNQQGMNQLNQPNLGMNQLNQPNLGMNQLNQQRMNQLNQQGMADGLNPGDINTFNNTPAEEQNNVMAAENSQTSREDIDFQNRLRNIAMQQSDERRKLRQQLMNDD